MGLFVKDCAHLLAAHKPETVRGGEGETHEASTQTAQQSATGRYDTIQQLLTVDNDYLCALRQLQRQPKNTALDFRRLIQLCTSYKSEQTQQQQQRKEAKQQCWR